ncbi:E3 ubiquitin-protein ligase TRIM38-like [Cyprinodon tularosa]|uniref:E3 ubiquitin-protein ligase TRIM38-like n=1 Tax=Cyprinodon tularosa TaxID=77115 RepID=UPI0018E273E6|nr:E3 ubiquitin-protein ligase TRIM38-like [Cyprinodon tularosa]
MATDEQLGDMTSMAKAANEDCYLEKHLNCPICMQTFTDPVTTSCGHSFCKTCLELSISSNQVDRTCPLCKTHLREAPMVNTILRDIVQEVKDLLSNRCTGASGEVPCDVCIEPKNKAAKSCLICLTSYCSTHLKNHALADRLRGHTLVEPVENLDTRSCLAHGYPLELYSRKQQKCICARCLDEPLEEVVSAEEECKKKKDQIGNTKTELQHRIMTRRTKIEEINEAFKSCKVHYRKICHWREFCKLFVGTTKAAKAKALSPLEDKLQLLKKESNDMKYDLEDEIKRLETTILKLEEISALEDHILFLQRYPSLIVQDDMKNWTHVNLNTSLSFGSMRETIAMIEDIQMELEKMATIELMRFPKYTVDVKLDPDTAHRRLVLSSDGSKMKDSGENQMVADSLKRFDVVGSVLGHNSLTTGRSYWEVEVSNKTGWDLGIVRGSANRRGRPNLSPENGYWVLVHFEECDVPQPYADYAAMTSPPISLSLKDKPKKVGVFLDYEEGLLSFYDVTNKSHIYTFSKCSFSDEIYPYFSLHMKYEINYEPMIISKVKI